jgi:hypothetical protein
VFDFFNEAQLIFWKTKFGNISKQFRCGLVNFIFSNPIMTNQEKLRLIKIAHTAIWVFFNVVIFYMLYAVIVNNIDIWLWMGYGIILIEGLVLLAFKMYCPLTVWARKYSDSTKDNFDIYLPNWLAKHNKLIYTLIMAGIIILTVYRLLT